jgi:RNA polymerase sigma factor for flagellar operon FliA
MNAATAETLFESTVGDARPTPQVLWKRYRQGADTGVEGSLVEEYLPLVRSMVGRLAMSLPSHVSQDDLNSSGLVGLLQALRSYDPTAGASFETYARIRVRGAIFDELRRMDWVPRLIHDKSRKIQAAIAELEQILGRSPTEVETAVALGLDLDTFERWMDEIRPVTFVCLDSTGHPASEETNCLHESIVDPTQESPAESASRNELKELIFERITSLPDTQRKVLSLYYLEGLRLREIAEAFGLTESRISQIHSQAILSLRAFVEKHEAAASSATSA